jgi:hypothetical protein
VSLEISSHPRFGRYFESHGPQWSLHLSDWLEARMQGERWQLKIDGEVRPFEPAEWTPLVLSAGKAAHRVEIIHMARAK